MDDYFITAVTAICSRSDLLKQNFLEDKSAEQVKRVGFKMNLEGRWQEVWVDLKLPFYLKSFDDPDNPKKKDYKIKHLGAPNQNHILWLSYLEKCYAKALEGYFNICLRGEPSHALTDLTGAPTRILDLTYFGTDSVFDWESQESLKVRKNEVWEQIKTSVKKGRFVCATSVSDECASKHYPEKFKDFIEKKAEEDKKQKKNKKQVETGEDSDHFMIEKFGLIDRHTYTILSCKELSDGTKLVLLRHNWGLHQWLGPWGINHEIWRSNVIPKEEKKLLKKLVEDKHQFFVPFEDFLALFDQVSISTYQKGNAFTSCRVNLSTNEVVVASIQVQKAGVYSIRLSQKSHQLQGLEFFKNQNGLYSTLTLAVVKENEVNTKLEGAICDASRDVFIESTLGIGIYTVYVSLIKSGFILLLRFIKTNVKVKPI